ncbi:MAG: M23 family metallopeptidase [Deltaproteobacteria bacterium]|nr:M23 family metallopeptidase [Deltaproteobacteria bacterium]
MKSKLNRITMILITAFIFFAVFVFIKKTESQKPDLEFALSGDTSKAIGSESQLAGIVLDAKSGLRSLSVLLIKDGTETVIFEKSFPKTNKVYTYNFNVSIKPKALQINDGKALLKAMATDYSWRNSGNGNLTQIEKEIVIDTKPPRIEILSGAHNIIQGGAGLVIYKLSEPCEISGIQAGDNFFPGYLSGSKDKNIFFAFIGLNYDQPTNTSIAAKAVDYAGNEAKIGFYKYLKKALFKQDVINITDGFLEQKMPEFSSAVNLKTKEASLIEQFLEVNRDIRKANFKQIQDICSNTEHKKLWKGTFLRFPQSANRAGFADARTYKYNGKNIDSQVHLGIDLASTAHAPIPAANSGKVVFAEFLGIYGNTVIIDHGFGLFSLYAHLNRIDAEKGANVKKGDIIGLSGMTGMAGGDHLHFSMLVHNIFVNPREWFDPSWIKNNITSKIEQLGNE